PRSRTSSPRSWPRAASSRCRSASTIRTATRTARARSASWSSCRGRCRGGSGRRRRADPRRLPSQRRGRRGRGERRGRKKPRSEARQRGDEKLGEAAEARKGRYALGSIAGLLVLAHLLTLERYGIFRDELYYAACGERLAWGYVDHPPLVALLARGSRVLFGESVGALRILPIFLSGVLVLLTGAIVRRLGGGRLPPVLAPPS